MADSRLINGESLPPYLVCHVRLFCQPYCMRNYDPIETIYIEKTSQLAPSIGEVSLLIPGMTMVRGVGGSICTMCNTGFT